jgi:amidophosphoribosyltransferase
VRDPLGVRPLVLGKLGDAWILASETCALDIIGADFVRDIEPGEMVILDGKAAHHQALRRRPHRFCVFEYIYFARPDSVMEGAASMTRASASAPSWPSEARAGRCRRPGAGFRRAGRDRLCRQSFAAFPVRARHHPQPLCRPHLHRADRPDPPSRREAEAQRQPRHDQGQARHPGRRFSIVRGTTSTKIVEMVRQAGAKEVHMRISSPPTTHSCFYGIDTPERSKLLAARMSVEEMAKFIGVDSLAFISMDGLYRAMGHAGPRPGKPQFCDACFTGDYPTALTDRETAEHHRSSRSSPNRSEERA